MAAACRGEIIELLSATPRDGWTVEVEDVEADRLAVEFHRGEQETQVAARCTDGTPVMADDRGSGSPPSTEPSTQPSTGWKDDDRAGDD